MFICDGSYLCLCHPTYIHCGSGLGQAAGHPQHRTDFILRRGGGGAVSIYNGASSIVWLRVIGKEDVVTVLGCPCFMLVILLRAARLLAQGTKYGIE